MVYSKYNDPWGHGPCCGTGPDAGQPDTPIRFMALNGWEQAHFDAHNMVAPTAADEQQSARVTGDTQRRYQQLADGTIKWGSGAAVADTTLSRTGAGLLQVGGALQVTDTIAADAYSATGALANSLSYTAHVTGDANDRYEVLADGTIKWGAGNAALDTQLFRAGVKLLVTDSAVLSSRSATSLPTWQSQIAGDTTPRFSAYSDGLLAWGDGTASQDVSLFRSSAGVLRTNSNFSVNKVGMAQDAELRVSADAGFVDSLRFRTGLLDRWSFQKSNDAESGGNGGSNLNFNRYDDAGVLIGSALNINRATGVVMINVPGVGSGAVVSVDGTQSLSNKTYQGSGAVATTTNITMKVTGDTSVRYSLNLQGDMTWSPGSGAQDTFFKRSAPGVLQATDTSLQSQRSLTTLLGHSVIVAGDTNPRWQVTAGGTVSMGPGNAAVDFSLARVGVNIASVSGVLQYTGTSGTGGFSTFITGDTVARIAMLNNGILFGPGNAVGDASLVRIATAVLGTQGLQASGAISAAGGYSSTRAAASLTYLSRVTGDTNDRWDVTSSGVMGFGPGNAAVDVTFTRSATAELTMLGNLKLNGSIGFYNTAPVAKPTVTGAKGSNAALASLLTALASQGLITDSTTA